MTQTVATYRQIYISFWQDPFVLALTPEEKYFYLYLLTNSKTTLCGIYELPLRMAEFETGCRADDILKMLRKLEDCGKIKYSPDTSEVCVRNWIKYNANRSPKVKIAVADSLRAVKDTGLIPYLYGIHTVSPVSVSVPVPDSVPVSDSVSVSKSVTDPSVARQDDTDVLTSAVRENGRTETPQKDAVEKTSKKKPDTDPNPVTLSAAESYTVTDTQSSGAALCELGRFRNVALSIEQRKSLAEKFPDDWELRIESLSEAIALRGYSYKNHYAVLLKWEMPGPKYRGGRKGTDLRVYNADAYDFDEIERVLASKNNKLIFKEPKPPKT